MFLRYSLFLSILAHAAFIGTVPVGNHRLYSSNPGLQVVELVPPDENSKAAKPTKDLTHSHRREGELPIEEKKSPPPQFAAFSNSDVSQALGSLRVHGEEEVDISAVLLSKPKLTYPKGALREGVEGDVGLYLVLDAEGNVLSAELVERAGYGFDEAALLAAKKLKFSPAKKNGEPVSVHIHWKCRFRIQS